MIFSFTKVLNNKHIAILLKEIEDVSKYDFNDDEVSFINNAYDTDNQINILYN